MDYDELAFKPELTWEELCEYAKSKDAWIGSGYFVFNYLEFFEDGDITTSEGLGETYFVARERSYAQMKTIIETLWG